jgi:hypothetical protein
MIAESTNSRLQWRLKHVSQDMPGPHGGTCANAAALAVAGFPNREVTSILELPESFCLVIGQCALTLNDAMPEDDLLDRLRPFAARLSSSSVGRRVADIRATHLELQAAVDSAPLALGRIGPAAAAHHRVAENNELAMAELETLVQREWPDDVRFSPK